MRISLVIIVFILLFSPKAFFAQDLQFYKEDLTFTILDNFLKVDGYYYFCNVGDKIFKGNLYYPFPVDSNYYDNIDSLKIEMGNTVFTNLKLHHRGVYIPILLESYKSIVYHITYRQKLLKNKAEYILTSTQQWNRPLESASYRLVIPESLKIKIFSYQPDSIKKDSNNTVFYWDRINFLPQKDMVFEFE
jgi:hypothetical protein